MIRVDNSVVLVVALVVFAVLTVSVVLTVLIALTVSDALIVFGVAAAAVDDPSIPYKKHLSKGRRDLRAGQKPSLRQKVKTNLLSQAFFLRLKMFKNMVIHLRLYVIVRRVNSSQFGSWFLGVGYATRTFGS